MVVSLEVILFILNSYISSMRHRCLTGRSMHDVNDTKPDNKAVSAAPVNISSLCFK